MHAEPVADPVAVIPIPATASSDLAVPGRWVLPALCLGSFVATLTFAAPAPFLADMARDFDAGVPLLGQVTAAMLLLSAPLGLVVGPLADRYGHRRLIVLGLGTAAACLLDIGLAPVVPVLFLASLFGSLSEAAVPGLSLAIAGTYFSGPAARRALGWTIASLASAPIVGVPLLAALGDATDWRVAFLAAGLVAVAAAALVAAWLPRDARRPEHPLRFRALLDAYRPLLRDGAMRRLYACCLLRAVCWFGMLTYFGAFLAERLGLGTGQVGLAYMLGGSGYFIGSLAAGGPLARVPPRPLLAGGNLAMALLMGLAFSATLGSAATIAVLPFAGFAGAVGWVGLAALLTAETPAGAGTTMVLNGSFFNLGAAAGGAVGGLLLTIAGYDALALGLPLFGLAAALLAWSPGSS